MTKVQDVVYTNNNNTDNIGMLPPQQTLPPAILDNFNDVDPEIGNKEQELEKNLTLFHTVSLAVGQIIGSGIFISPNVVLKGVGSMGISLIVWALAGVLSVCGALCFGELGAMYPQSGGECQYNKVTYGRLAGFANLWVLIIVCSMGIAVIALTFSSYLICLFADPEYAHFEMIKKIVAASAVVIVIGVCIYGTKLGVWVQSIFTVLKVLSLIFLVVIAIIFLGQGNVENISSGFTGSNLDVSDWSGAMLSALWAYNGWTSISVIASEVQNPEKNLPRALVITGLSVTVIYVIVNLAYHALLSPAQLAQSESVAVFAGETFFAPYGPGAVTFVKYFFAGSVALSTFGSLLSMVLSTSRLPYVGALDNMMPGFFGLVSKRSKTPVTSLLFVGLTSFVCIWPSNIGSLIQYVGFLSWIFWGLCFAAVIILRFRNPNTHRPFKVPLFVPVIAILTSVFLILGPTISSPLTSLLWLLVTFVSVPVYYGYVDNEGKCDGWMRKLTHKLTYYLEATTGVSSTDSVGVPGAEGGASTSGGGASSNAGYGATKS